MCLHTQWWVVCQPVSSERLRLTVLIRLRRAEQFIFDETFCMMVKLSIVIPAYNEENGISAILERVLSIQPGLEALGIAGPEVVVVDDGSCDRTAEIVGANPAVRLVRHPTNRGYGAALKTGFCNATGDLLA